MGRKVEEEVKETPAPKKAPKKAPKVKAPAKSGMPADGELNKMTKVDLEKFARAEFDVELDRRKTKANMIAELKQGVK